VRCERITLLGVLHFLLITLLYFVFDYRREHGVLKTNDSRFPRKESDLNAKENMNRKFDK
jgi:hypothetical protein